ncbi:MAG: MarR family transcriptional regulator [Pseudomonadales bacterium]|nr:MarR family transcriptional regulator [Pseudomonadales bacterium]
MEDTTEAVLASIRKIIRASDLHSSHIRRTSGLTSPQLMLLRAIRDFPSATLGQLAEQISLSQATATTILNRLETMDLAARYRSEVDRRKSHVQLTEMGESVLRSAPHPMQAKFISEFETLKPFEQTAILSTLQHVAEMMQHAPESNESSLDESAA